MNIPSSAATQPAQIEEATRGQPEPSIAPLEVEQTTAAPVDDSAFQEPEKKIEENVGNVVNFPAQKSKRGRPQKSAAESYRVSVEKVSLNTYAVRIRWKREDGSDHPGVVVNRLNDNIVKEIKRSKKRYEQFKSQTLSSWQSRAVRQSDQSRTNPRRAV